MDIGSMGSTMDYISQVNSLSKSDIEKKLESNPQKSSNDEELLDACKEFEAYFMEQMFKEMQKTIPKSEDESSYTTQIREYFEGNMLQEISKESTETNSLGLAQMLFEQMKRNEEST